MFPPIDLDEILFNLGHLGVAFALALPIGWDRESSDSHAGLRTFPLVSLASCAFLLLGGSVTQGGDAYARVFQGVITGVGFLGGGAIAKHGLTIRGTATAAAIWNTAAIGTAVAAGRLEIAIVLAVTGFAALRWMRPLKAMAKKEGAAQSDESKESTA